MSNIENPLITFIKKNHLDKNSREIIFYGGSFNPWHEGHMACLKLAPIDLNIIIIPDINPLKNLDGVKKENPIDKIKNAISQLEQKCFVFEDFYHQNKPNPTADWIQDLKQSDLNQKYSLLIGYDSFISIEKWINAELLLNALSTLYIVDRQNNEKTLKKHQESLNNKFPKLKLVLLGKHPFEGLSSTKIRENQLK